MKYNVIINRNSGNCNKLNLAAITDMFGNDTEVHYTDDGKAPCRDCDAVVVCGGDGTLKNALDNYRDKPIFFVPCGTFNETRHLGDSINFVGDCNGQSFGYVCATGSFTEIGYSTKCAAKRRLKCFAYILQVLKWYKSHKIKAKINIDGKSFDGEYTLLMAIKNNTCFGFPFNKMYDKKPQPYLLGVKSCGNDNLFNRAKMFFPFFRIFFCGVRQPTVCKGWFMLPFDNATITLDKPRDFCIDGELRTFGGELRLTARRLTHPVTILDCPQNIKKHLRHTR